MPSTINSAYEETQSSLAVTTTINSELDDEESSSQIHPSTQTFIEGIPSEAPGRDFFHQLEARFKAGWERLRAIRSSAPSLYSKRKTERQRLEQISHFIDDSPFSISTYHSLPEQTKALASLWQIPFTSICCSHGNRPTIPVVFSLLRLRIIDSEDTGRQIASNATFTFELEYGGTSKSQFFRWTIKRSLIDIIKLHSILSFRHVVGEAPEMPKFPSQLTYIIDFTLLGLSSKVKREARRLRHAEHRKKMLERYFIHLLTRMGSIHCKELCEFLEVSMHDFVHFTGQVSASEVNWKGKEGFLMNKSPPEGKASFFYRLFWLIFYCTRNTYYQKWFIIREGYIAIFNDLDDLEPVEVMLCDRFFNVNYSHVASINPLKPMIVKVHNANKKCEFLVDNNFHATEWSRDLDRLQESCSWGKDSRFDSYAPIRRAVQIEFYVDAEEFFWAVSTAIEGAKREIFIHGFWVSPELHLRRPAAQYPTYRLDRLLERKAIEGVKVYLIVYKEVSVALSINSLHTKTSLERLHPNITVVRNPDHFSGSLYWSHHEKIVCIDQEIAFTGGLDLSFGRFDTPKHQIKDNNREIWTGIDYSNPIVRDFRNIHDHESTSIDPQQIPRLAWHDVHCGVYDVAAASDISRHFVERWNYIKSYKKSEKMKFLLPSPAAFSPAASIAKGKGNFTVQSLRSVCEWSSGVHHPERSIYNAYVECIRKAQRFIYLENQFFLSRTSSEQQGNMKNCIAQEIITKIIEAHREGRPFKVIILIPLMPAFESFSYTVSMILQTTQSTISKGKGSIFGLLRAQGINPDDYIAFVSLRAWEKSESDSESGGGVEGCRFFTEQIYVHSKIMIVDDRFAILGSANINDRSLLGIRDSEHALYLEESILQYEKILKISKDEGKASLTKAIKDQKDQNAEIVLPYGKALRQLRIKLFEEHFGESNPLFLHPWKDEFFAFLLQTSRTNAQIYQQVFQCLPNDEITTWEKFRNSPSGSANNPPYSYAVVEAAESFQEKDESKDKNESKDESQVKDSKGQRKSGNKVTKRSHQANSHHSIEKKTDLDHRFQSINHKLSQIKGRIVEYSYGFLEDENLIVSMLSPEYFLPVDLYI